MLTLPVICFGVTATICVLTFLLSLTRYHQGLNFLVNGNRFAGLSRVFGGVALISAAATLVLAALSGAFQPDWSVWLIVPFLGLAGTQLLTSGQTVLQNYPR